MRLPVDDILRSICQDIRQQSFEEQAWAAVESDDWFRKPPYEGGFDATENAFCFSYFAEGGHEYWFQFPLSAVEKVLQGEIQHFEARSAT